MPVQIEILIIEDNPAEARLFQEWLQGSSAPIFNVVCARYLHEGLACLERQDFDAILLDLTLPDSQGLDSLAPLLDRAPSVPIVVLTNTNDRALAIEAVRRGAQDYLIKRQVNVDALVRALHYSIERKQALESVRAQQATLEAQIEKRTEELAQVRERDRQKAELVSMLSHDIRSPLNSILLSAGLLREPDNRLSQEKRAAHFQSIRSAVKNLSQLLDEASFIGKSDAGHLQFEPEPLDLAGFCEQLLAEVANHCEGDRDFRFKAIGPKACASDALWDASLLYHALNNVLGNAIKYSPEGSEIVLELEIDPEIPDRVWLRVRDRGIGIPAAECARVCQPFQRGTNVGDIPGTGLGLAIALRCCAAHGGTLSLESREGFGTTATLALPLAR